MSRPSREKNREQWPPEPSAILAAAPIDVLVPAAGPDAGGATIGGVPLAVADGEDVQQAVLSHLHRIALATGHPVHASIHDERHACVVPLQVNPDGSSHLTGAPAPARTPAPQDFAPQPPEERPAPPAPPAPPPMPAVPLGTVAPPTGVFGPPPVMDAVPPADSVPPMDPVAPTHGAGGVRGGDEAVWPEAPVAAPLDAPTPRLTPIYSSPSSSPDTSLLRPLLPALEADPDPRPTSTAPTPARGFDAVAEAVLGDEPPTVPAFLMEPMVRVNEAVRAGRIAEAAELADGVVAEASAVLGAEHPEVLKVRELTAYISYLAGEPVRAFQVSLDLARIHRRTRDAEGAYGNVQSAASAWRAVRDPELGLALGHDLIGLWTELVAEDGPAAQDVERLESARTRMGRLTERARKAAQRSG
ncbi:tetratricopeptide repeat protein [Streptomyces sp. NPDC005648]|uniref:tetratricopeptide repeat protein n=1 Tax=Streptomyces sp. NPDC005648 TaxID=3157044 RepID=UPI0033BC1349